MAMPIVSLLLIALSPHSSTANSGSNQKAVVGATLESRFSPDLKILYFSADAPSSNTPNSTDKPVSNRIFEIPILFETMSAHRVHCTSIGPNACHVPRRKQP